jgi:hypothetical protein
VEFEVMEFEVLDVHHLIYNYYTIRYNFMQ